MVRGFNVNMNQVSGSGDNLGEQSRPLLQVEDIRRATGGDKGLLDSRDHGFFTVDMPNYWERPELAGLLRDVRQKPDKYEWLDRQRFALPMSSYGPKGADDVEILDILHGLRDG